MDELLRQNWLRRHARNRFAAPPAGEVPVARAEHGLFRDMTSLQGRIEQRDIIYLDAGVVRTAFFVR